MKKIVLLLLVSASLFSFSAYAQKRGSDYKSAIGGRFGNTYYDVFSFSYKTFITDPGALELNAGFGAKGYGNYNTATLSAAISYQHHFDIKPVQGLKWFVGGGATIFNTFSKKDNDYTGYSGFGLGIFPTGGIDYKFASIPLNLTADARPTFHVVSPGYYNSVYGNFGIAARYTFR